MAEIPLEGFQVDTTKAQAMADAIEAVFRQADQAGPRTPDKLAALGIAAALVILRSKLQRSPEEVARKLADYIAAQVRAIGAAGGTSG